MKNIIAYYCLTIMVGNYIKIKKKMKLFMVTLKFCDIKIQKLLSQTLAVEVISRKINALQLLRTNKVIFYKLP